jgi:uncharacterized protein YjiS (DUF1127 family)
LKKWAFQAIFSAMETLIEERVMANNSYLYRIARDGAPRSPSQAVGAALGAIGRAFDQLLLWGERARSRHRLLALDDRMLQDIGIDRSTAEREAAMPFWRLEEGDAAARVGISAPTARPRRLSASCCG